MKRFGYAAVALGLLAVTAAHAEDPAKVTSANGKAAMGLLDMCFNQHKVAEAFAKYVGPTYKQHNPTVPDGKDAAIKGLSGFVAQMPDMHYDVKRVLVDGDLVAVHSHVALNATDRGSAVVDIFRLEHGKVVEHWDVLQAVPEKPVNDNTMF